MQNRRRYICRRNLVWDFFGCYSYRGRVVVNQGNVKKILMPWMVILLIPQQFPQQNQFSSIFGKNTTMRIKIILCILISSIAFSVKAQVIKPEEASKHVGDSLTVCGEIFTARYLDGSNMKPTLLNMGAAYPDNPITIVIFDDVRTKFNFKPEEKWIHKDICVTGKIELYKGKPEIVIHDPAQIKEK